MCIYVNSYRNVHRNVHQVLLYIHSKHTTGIQNKYSETYNYTNLNNKAPQASPAFTVESANSEFANSGFSQVRKKFHNHLLCKYIINTSKNLQILSTR